MIDRIRKFLRGDSPPAPDRATPEQVAKYNQRYLQHHPYAQESTPLSDPTMAMNFAKEDRGEPNYKSEFPWLFNPDKGVRWEFDPIELRTLSQENPWVQMMVQSITMEIAETSWTITDETGPRETDKRLNTHPDKRSPIQKDLPDETSEEIYHRLKNPTPDFDWNDAVEMWMRDYLEVGSMVGNKVFDDSAYVDDELQFDGTALDPLYLRPTPPEVWTKAYDDRSGILSGYWQFDRRSTPGSNTRQTRGISEAIHFNPEEVMWGNHSPATNRAYGIPPTLIVKEELQSLDLAVQQEQQYLSRGSIPSGAWVFENWDREELQEWKQENEENVKGKPHKSLMFAGRGGDVRFEKMSMNFKELEFTERMRWYARVIAAAFQVPTAVVGIEPEKVNYNTFQGERENFETNTLGPYLQDLERWLNSGFLSHWDGYRFEFTPGMSETTKQMRSSRVLDEWNNDLRQRLNAARELGIELPEDTEDGFKSEVVETTTSEDAGDALDGLMASEMEKDSDGVPVEALKEIEQRTGADGSIKLNGKSYVKVGGEWKPKAKANWDRDWNQGVYTPEQWADSDVIGQNSDGEVIRRSEVDKQEDDEPLRNTDDWADFDVQPGEIETLAEELNEKVGDLFDDVLSDEEIQRQIERMAAEETDKSLSAIQRRLKELLSENEVASTMQTRLDEATTTAALEAVRSASSEVGEDVDVDIAAIESKLEDRSVAFADRFANQMAEDIRRTVSEGWAEGEGTQDIAREIADQADINEGWNGAERIARQELQVATGEARSEFAAEAGKVEVWQTSQDGDRVRDAHQRMQGKWKRPGEDFVVPYERGEENENVPGNSEKGIGCRCQVLLRNRDEVDSSDYAGSDGL